MTTDDLRYIEKELNKSRDELLEVVVALKKQADRDAIYRIENERALTAMAKDYQKITNRLEEVLTENKALKETLARIAEQAMESLSFILSIFPKNYYQGIQHY